MVKPPACRTKLRGLLNTRLFKALGDPTRVGLLAYLAERCAPLTVNEAAQCCPIDISVVSRHLAVLRDAGVLEAAKEGREVRYSIRYPESVKLLRDLADALDGCCPINRRSVSEFYVQEISSSETSCCCGGSPVPKGVAAKIAGYSRDDLAALPADAVANSFGCGNPLAFSEVKEGDVVLDLGSGAGIDILLAAKKVGPRGRAIGIDMTDEMLAKARENIAAAGLTNAEVRKGIIEELPVETASVDWVISNCVINLSPEKPRVFAEIARVLRPGGRMLVSDIVAQDLPEWIRQSAVMYGSCVAGAISEDEYLAGLRAAGLVDVKVHERLTYDTSQIKSIIASELPKMSCCSEAIDDKTIAEIAGSLGAKVWSAKVFARKPAPSDR